LPIPPGTHWKDAKPLVLPSRHEGTPPEKALRHEAETEKKALPEASPSLRKRKRKEAPAPVPGAAKPEATRLSGFRFAAPAPEAAPAAEAATKAKPKREPRQKRKNDPKLVAAARELRDRWLEQVNLDGGERLLPSRGKYDVTRPPPLEGIVEQTAIEIPGVEPVKMLPAA
jgi:hypothetical protein